MVLDRLRVWAIRKLGGFALDESMIRPWPPATPKVIGVDVKPVKVFAKVDMPFDVVNTKFETVSDSFDMLKGVLINELIKHLEDYITLYRRDDPSTSNVHFEAYIYVLPKGIQCEEEINEPEVSIFEY